MNSTVKSTTVNNETSSWQLLPRSEGIAFCVAFIVESFAIMIGNAIVIAVFAKNRQLRKQKFYLLINLAIADFLVGAIVAPWWVSHLARDFDLWKYKMNIQTVIAMRSIHMLLTHASLFNLMMVSLERMYATLWPLKHRVLETPTYYVFIGLGWILPISPFFVALYFVKIPKRKYELVSFIWLFFICLILLIICISYVSIWIKIKYAHHPKHHVTTAQDRKLTMSLFIVTVVSLVTWLPFPVRYFIMFRFRSLPKTSTYYSFILLFFANSLVNPIIYSLRMPQFRQAALRLVCRRSAKRPMTAIEMRNVAKQGN